MLQSCIYMAAMGAGGLRAVASLCHDKAHYAAAAIASIPGFKVLTKTFFKEFLVRTPKPAADIYATLAKRRIVPGFPISRYDASRPNELLVCVTEMNTKSEIDRLAAALKEVSA